MGKFRQGTLPPERTDSDKSFAWITGRLDYCSKNHHRFLCAAARINRMPTRLLKIEDIRQCDGPLRVCLCEEPPPTRYICLSYCWGSVSSPFIQTTRAILPHFKKRIPWRFLPKAFQDVIEIARKLDVQYIWIDSLCIIQDDEADWQRESSRMASIFQGAWLTFAATGFAGPHEGLFSTLSRKYQAHKVHASSIDEKFAHVYVRRPLPHFHDHVEEFPLLKRAWAYQVGRWFHCMIPFS